MAEISSEEIVKLREKTGCGMMDCKKALLEAGGDMDKAIDALRKKGLAAVATRAARTAAQGLIDSYIHTGGKIGVLLEVNCETDFVARSVEFQGFVKDIAMQIAAQNPQYIYKDEVPEGIINHEKDIIADQAQQEGKPEKAIEKIVEGRLQKFYEEVCLMEQPFVKNPEVSVKEHIVSYVAKIGENIVIRRFPRYQVGEEI
jgi:elongation factor Ts